MVGLLCPVYFQDVSVTVFKFLAATLGAIPQDPFRLLLSGREGAWAVLIYFNFHLTNVWPERYTHSQHVYKLDFRAKYHKFLEVSTFGMGHDKCPTSLFLRFFAVKKKCLKTSGWPSYSNSRTREGNLWLYLHQSSRWTKPVDAPFSFYLSGALWGHLLRWLLSLLRTSVHSFFLMYFLLLYCFFSAVFLGSSAPVASYHFLGVLSLTSFSSTLHNLPAHWFQIHTVYTDLCLLPSPPGVRKDIALKSSFTKIFSYNKVHSF